MDQIPINITDLAALFILVFSGLLAFSRGCVHEVLAVFGWVGAALLTLHLFPVLQPFARQYIKMTLAADAITGIAIFVVTLVILTWISHQISKRVRDSALSALDRSLGFLFGVLRGAVLVCIAWLLFVSLLPRDDHPKWIKEARSLPLIERGTQVLLSPVPGQALGGEDSTIGQAVDEAARGAGRAIDDAASRAEDAAEEAARKATDGIKDIPRTFLAPQAGPANPPDSDEEKGYKASDRRQMDRLLRDQDTNVPD